MLFQGPFCPDIFQIRPLCARGEQETISTSRGRIGNIDGNGEQKGKLEKLGMNWLSMLWKVEEAFFMKYNGTTYMQWKSDRTLNWMKQWFE